MLREQRRRISKRKRTRFAYNANQYNLGRQLGRGTFGTVFHAINEKDGSVYAIKEVLQDKRYKNRELDIISRLDNDNIIEMKDYYYIHKYEEKYLYLVMDYYEMTLHTLLKKHRIQKTNLPSDAQKVIIFQMFKALYYMHYNNVCHRDLKPPNLLINPQNYQLRVCDFGSAKILEKEQKNISYICSRYYRAPELLLENSSYRTEIDVWSAGCIMVELFTKQPMFPGDSSIEQLIEIMKVLGTPEQSYLSKYAQLKEPLKLPKIPPTSWGKILKLYRPEKLFLHLISTILVYDVQERLNPFEVLKHEYFHDLPKLKITKKLPNLFEFDRLKTIENKHEIKILKKIYSITEPKIITPQESNKSLLDTQNQSPL